MYDFDDKSLEELLNEIKVYGDVYIQFKDDHKWYFKYVTKINNKEYTIENTGKDLYNVVKSCMSAINKFPIRRLN